MKEFPFWSADITSQEEFAWLKNNARVWEQIITNLAYGGDSMPGFVRGCPIRIYNDNGKKCFLLSGVGSTTLYNIQKTDERSRAREVFQTQISEPLGIIARGFDKTDIDEIGVMVTYGIEDFSERIKLTKAEALIVIVPLADAKLFKENKITEDDLVAKATTYLYVDPVQLKRITLKLQ